MFIVFNASETIFVEGSFAIVIPTDCVLLSSKKRFFWGILFLFDSFSIFFSILNKFVISVKSSFKSSDIEFHTEFDWEFGG